MVDTFITKCPGHVVAKHCKLESVGFYVFTIPFIILLCDMKFKYNRMLTLGKTNNCRKCWPLFNIHIFFLWSIVHWILFLKWSYRPPRLMSNKNSFSVIIADAFPSSHCVNRGGQTSTYLTLYQICAVSKLNTAFSILTSLFSKYLTE